MAGLLDFAQMAQGLLGIQPVAAPFDFRKKGLNPIAETEGARGYGGGANPQNIFALGRDVNLALPGEATLRPNTKASKDAANKLGITQAEARRAWNLFTWGK